MTPEEFLAKWKVHRDTLSIRGPRVPDPPMVAVYIKLLEDYEVMTAEEIAKRDGIKHRLVTTRLDRLRDYGFIAKVNSRVIDPTTVTVRAGMGGISISDETIAAVLELRASGMTYREIARKLNIALNTAWRTFVANDKP